MGWTLQAAAERMGTIDASTIARHEIGRCLPRAEELLLYEQLTGGEVTAQDFIAQRQLFNSNPAKARKRVGARTIDRAKKGALA